ncbi:MAG: protein-glutamate O-methyltransferase CheR [Pseudomonadales bacterium]|nr:protein-glutamate O-methyltransferase CheR [Pseudomonadales bacterium]
MVWPFNVLPPLTDEEFKQWQTLLEDRTGISFERHKIILQTGLGQRMREIDCANYDDYYRIVCLNKGGALEWEALLRTLTVKETRFFRDEDAIEFVRKYLFKRMLSKDSGRSLELWSVACSTGEEPYSLAMLANDCIEGMGAKKFYGVMATDICQASLSEARKGRYPPRRLEFVDTGMQGRYFNVTESGCQVVEKIKNRVCFVQANIIELENLPVSDMDVIYCQNVLIYFKSWRRNEVLDELVKRLKPKGLLVLGMGEAVGWSNAMVERVKNDSVQAYQRIA